MSTFAIPGWSNLGPLTSIFTAPTPCSQLTISYPTILPPTTSSTILFPTPTTSPHIAFYDPVLAPSCFPPKYQTNKAEVTIPPYASPTSNYFYPGRCPSNWEAHTLKDPLLPASYTMALCCPTLPLAEPTKGITRCGFTLPTRTLDSLPTVSGYNVNNIYKPITAVAQNGTLTTLTPQQWFAIGGSITGRYVFATGINVVWKKGDFPDLDAEAAEASASMHGKTTHDADSEDGYHEGSPHVNLTAVILGAGLPFMALVAGLFWFLFRRKQMHFRGDSMRAAMKRCVRRKGGSAGVDSSAGKNGPDGALLLTIRNGKVVSRTEGMRDNEGQISKVGEEAPPPPYAAGPSVAVQRPVPSGYYREWHETNLEYDTRRAREKKEEMLLEKIRLARERDLSSG